MGFCFPHHNGHTAWPHLAETVEDAAVEDLFWRKMQTDPAFTKKVMEAVWPSMNESQHELIIGHKLGVSLMPESCGAYGGPEFSNLPYLHGDSRDVERVQQGILNPDSYGYYPGLLIAKKRGWLPKNVVRNLMQEVKENLTVSYRFHFNQKANHHQILINELAKEKIEAVIASAYPTLYGFSQYVVYWYRAENGQITHGIVYFKDSQGNIHKLPISAWEPECPTRRRTSVYDMLNFVNPYPLYCLNRLVTFSVSDVLVCTSEATVENIYKNHGWYSNYMPVTTYSSLTDTDWTKIKGQTPIIFPDASKFGCYEAFRLHATLKKLGFGPRFIKRQKDAVVGSLKFDQDLMSGLAFSNDGCSFPEFAEHCLQEFNVQPPEGVLQKAVPLSSLPETDVAQEPLMEGLLDTGDQMMIHAWRGVGKSLFAMLLGLCFASGKSALNGRVCPSRRYRVLLLDGEMSAHSLKKRARRLCAGHGLQKDALADVKVRSIIAENKDLTLETDEGVKECMPDLMWADIIIVDSVFKFFPRAMNSDFTAVEKLLDFLKLCRLAGKTLILIDHEGKGRGTSFGTMGKEIALDVVLRLCHAKSPHVIEAHVQKVRDHAEPSGPYLRMRIEADKDECITIQNCDASKVVAALGGESADFNNGEAESPKSPAERTALLDEAIKEYIHEHPDAAQKEIVTALMDRGYGCRSTIQARIKVLSEGGQLPDWQNRTKTHKVAEQAAPEGDEN